MTDVKQKYFLTGSDFFILSMQNITDNVFSGINSHTIISLKNKINTDILTKILESSELIKFLTKTKLKRILPLMKPYWSENSDNIANLVQINENSEQIDFDLLNNLNKKEYLLKNNISFNVYNNSSNNSTLIISWNHALLDAKGIELLLAYINKLHSCEINNNDISLLNGYHGKNKSDSLNFFSKISYGRKSLPFITESSKLPIANLYLNGNQKNNVGKYSWICFDDEQSEKINKTCHNSVAGLRQSLYYLAASIKSIHKILIERNSQLYPFYIPVPHNLRKCGAMSPILSNQVTFLFFRIEPKEVTSIQNIYNILNKQMLYQIRNGIPESFSTMMDLFKPAPFFLSSYIFNKPTKKQIASFFFSDTGNSYTNLKSFLGNEIQNIIHIPPISSPPGLTVTFSTFKNKLNMALSYVDSCLTIDDLRLFNETMTNILLG